MKIAVIAFGSLVNDPRDLQVEVDDHSPQIPEGVNIQPHSPFRPAEGLSLPIRLGRKSGQETDNRRITMVLYPTASEEQVYYAKHKYTDLNSAIKNLREREGIPKSSVESIAYVKKDNATRCRYPQVAEKIGNWMSRHGFDAAIWCDLASNISFAASSKGREIQQLLRQDATLLHNTKQYINLLPNPKNTLQQDIMNM